MVAAVEEQAVNLDILTELAQVNSVKWDSEDDLIRMQGRVQSGIRNAITDTTAAEDSDLQTVVLTRLVKLVKEFSDLIIVPTTDAADITWRVRCFMWQCNQSMGLYTHFTNKNN